MNIYEIDMTGVRDREAIHDRLAEALPLPEYYGRNLDALYDVLTSAAEPFQIVFSVDTEQDPVISTYLLAVRDVCADAAKELEGSSVEWIKDGAVEE